MSVKHVVLFRFKRDTPPEKLAEIAADLAALQHKVPGIVDYSGGTNTSPEGLEHGFTFGFVMTFTNAAARDVYLPHPAHEAVVEKILPLLDGGLVGALVIDWYY